MAHKLLFIRTIDGVKINAIRDGHFSLQYHLKGNPFYGKMIEHLENHSHTTFTKDEAKVDSAFRSKFFEDLDQIEDAYEIKLRKN